MMDTGKVTGVGQRDGERRSVGEPVFGKAEDHALVEAHNLLNVVQQSDQLFSRSLCQKLFPPTAYDIAVPSGSFATVYHRIPAGATIRLVANVKTKLISILANALVQRDAQDASPLGPAKGCRRNISLPPDARAFGGWHKRIYHLAFAAKTFCMLRLLSPQMRIAIKVKSSEEWSIGVAKATRKLPSNRLK
jgi:hypothetical protein